MRCTKCNETPCQEKDCSCKVYITSDCVNNVKAVFECLNIETGLDLTQTLEAMDAALCERFEAITNFFTLINTGTGANVYKGNNLLGQKEIRKINAVGDLVTVTQNTLDISISIDEEELINFVQDNQFTVVIENVGNGEDLVKTPVTVGNNTTYPIKSLKSESLSISSTPNEVIIEDLTEYESNDNSILITRTGDTINFRINPTFLQDYILGNSGLICNIVDSCTNSLVANDDYYGAIFLPESVTILNVLDNDTLGSNTPVNIISVDATGLSPLVAVPTITVGGQSITLTMGTTFNSGVVYTFTYTIEDSLGNLSTATVSFEDLS